MSDAEAEAILEFDHNVVEHLGISLYQNKPAAVLAELVANAWDADANHVWLEVGQDDNGEPFMAVADDGHGMTHEAVRTRYLVVGKPKRKTPKDQSPGGRKPMGRKGIGKLAPFGVARKVDVVTIADGLINWFVLDLDGIRDAGQGKQRYKPAFPLENADLFAALPDDLPHRIRSFIERIRADERGMHVGTLVLMSKFSANRLLDADEVRHGLVNRFTVVLARDDFSALVNDAPITREDALPDFEFRIPPEAGSSLTAKVDGRDVRYWAGFVGSAEWSADQAGVGVFVHGKIAQDRPFFFGAKGKEIFQRYLYAVVEADWLDEFDRDLVSTDRSTLDWNDEYSVPLRDWGRKQVSSWLEAYSTHRSQKHGSEVRTAARDKRAKFEIPVFSEHENEQVDELVSAATRDLGKGKDADAVRDELLNAVSKAWMNLPTRRLLTDLWADLASKGASGEDFAAVASRLQEYSVPESMSLAMTFAQRAYALSLLHDLVHKKSETKLQLLIEEFPWILNPRGDLLTADQHLKTTIEKAADSDATKDRAGRMIKGMSAKERADFVYLTDPGKKTIEIVEIKAPSVMLGLEESRQLTDYLDFTKTFHGTAVLTGVLIGNPGSPRYESNDNRITVKGWDELLLECRAAYVELLAAMLEQADVDPSDSRLELVKEFGGDRVWELLTQLSEKDASLKLLMSKFEGSKAA